MQNHKHRGVDCATGIDLSMAAARDGSFTALGQLLDHYRDYLLRIARDELAADLSPKVAASDIVQETFLQAARAFPRFNGQSEAEMRAWLRQIMLHNLQDVAKFWRQAEKRTVVAEIPLDDQKRGPDIRRVLKSPEPSPSTYLCRAEDRQRVQQALARLTTQYVRVITLRTFEQKTFDEVGAAMHRTPEAARKLWSRAVERLAEELVGQHGFDGAAV